MTEPILVADIGGTHARFGLALAGEDGISVNEVRKFRADKFESLFDAARVYLDAVGLRPKTACFAVAGPITDAQVEFTNSPWVLNIEQAKRALSLTRFHVVNDFEALAAGVPSMRDEDFVQVKPGAGDPDAPILVMGPGTGLGQALIVPFGDQHRIVPTEGGHVSFAPYLDEEVALMHFLTREHERVSVERILSGPGIVNIHRFYCELKGAPCGSTHADEITAAAMKGADPMAIETMNMFFTLLGRAAGDAVLGTGARGGVVLGGGILPKIRELFLDSAFVESFLAKGRMRYYLEDAPIRLIIGEGGALLGAAVMAGAGRAE